MKFRASHGVELVGAGEEIGEVVSERGYSVLQHGISKDYLKE